MVCLSCSSQRPPSDEWKKCVPGESFAACKLLGESYIQVGSLRRVNAGPAGVLANIRSPTDVDWHVYYSMEVRPERFEDVLAMLDNAAGPRHRGRIGELSLDAEMYWKTKHGFWAAENLTSTIWYYAPIHGSATLTDDEVDRSAAQQQEEIALWTKICAYLASH
jgi:hypothetical protein